MLIKHPSGLEVKVPVEELNGLMPFN